MKRFKKKDGSDIFSANDLSLDPKNTQNAKDVFRQIATQTNYAKNFGDRPMAKQDFNILRDKPFCKLPIAQVLKPQIAAMLGRWLTINDQDKFTGRIYYTVREMFTVIKNQLADVPTSQDFHSNHVELNATPPRFDRMIVDLNNKRRQKANSQIRLDNV